MDGLKSSLESSQPQDLPKIWSNSFLTENRSTFTAAKMSDEVISTTRSWTGVSIWTACFTTLAKTMSTKDARRTSCVKRWTVTTARFLRTDKPERGRRSPWPALRLNSNIEASRPELYSSSSRKSPRDRNTQLPWDFRTWRFTTRWCSTCCPR